MNFNQIRGSQIQPGVLKDAHFANDAAISESKLNIDWNSRGDEILAKKLVVDYVQVNGKAVASNSGSIDVSGQITGTPATTDSAKGPVTQSSKNKVILRDAVTGDPLIGSDGHEVYGRLTEAAGVYTVTFYSKDTLGVEQPHTVADATTIDFQYPSRFDFLTVAENFAANEKFVDGASDVSARLDLQQIAKDLFGGGYVYDHDGESNRVKPLSQELAEEVTARGNADTALQGEIDAVESDLATYKSDNNAAVATLAGRVSTAETDIDNLEGRATDLEVEVQAARGGQANVNARLTGIETNVSTNASDIADVNTDLQDYKTANDARVLTAESEIDDLQSEVGAARNGKANLNAELEAIRQSVADEATSRQSGDDAIADRIDGVEEAIAAVHKHYAEDKKVASGDPLIGASSYVLQSSEAFVVGNKSLQVFINGMLQMVGEGYSETADPGDATRGIGVSFAPQLLAEGDIIQLRWSK